MKTDKKKVVIRDESQENLKQRTSFFKRTLFAGIGIAYSIIFSNVNGVYGADAAAINAIYSGIDQIAHVVYGHTLSMKD
jgi:hypothetical protein